MMLYPAMRDLLAKVPSRYQPVSYTHLVLVLAQASMSVLIPCLADITKPILSSMDSGVEAAAKALKGL